MELIPTVLRALQILWLVILTGLIGNVIANNVAGPSESAVNFSMFVIVLTWIAALYSLIGSFIESVAVPIVVLALDGLATLFTFISAVVLAAKLGAVNCSDTANRGDWIAYGSFDDQKRCRELQASTFFMWTLFAMVAVTLGLFAMGWRRGGGSVRSGGPGMSQVRV